MVPLEEPEEEARDKLERWADDQVLAAEKAQVDTKEQIKVQRRLARQAASLEEEKQVQEKIRRLEAQQRRQRQEIFQVEDAIVTQRDRLIEVIEKRLAQRIALNTLFFRPFPGRLNLVWNLLRTLSKFTQDYE